jgi:GT2 family glycosyltransferase
MASPTVTIVFLVYNRREELRISLERMLGDSNYPGDRVDVIVVDNASDDGAAEMVRAEFPDVRLIRREVNVGVSGFNDGFAAARGDYVLALDDDCYLPPDGLSRAVALAEDNAADLVSFGVASAEDHEHRFDLKYPTGLLTFWGCAVLIRRRVLEALDGYDPEIFVWANELEFMMRFFDAGFRHLHAPEIVAVHMKAHAGRWRESFGARPYLTNARHFAYIAAKLMRPRDAVEALVALMASSLRHGLLYQPAALRALPAAARGFRHGLRHREPLRNADISRTYRRCFESYASPWWLSRSPVQLLFAVPAALVRRALGRPHEPKHPGRRELYYAERARYYPTTTATLQM